MRVGIDASNIRAGGGITHLVEILNAFQPEAIGPNPVEQIKHVTVWGNRRLIDALPVRPWLQGVHVPEFEKSLISRIRWQMRELPVLAETTSDILFVPGGGTRKFGKTFVTMSQNMLPFDFREMRRFGFSLQLLRLLLLRFTQTRGFRRADGVIFLTEYARSAILRQIGGIKGESEVIPHGVNPVFFQPPKLQRSIETYTELNPFRLLYVSIVTVYKHQWHVVEAVAKLRQLGMMVTLDLIGPAEPNSLVRLHDVLQRVDPQGTFIHYHKAVSYEHLPNFYHEADAFVFASTCENMPNIVLEAMASGLPIASSDRAPMPEMLGDAGIYFDPENVEDIAKGLGIMLNELLTRSQNAAVGYAKAQQYKWERAARDTFQFMARVEYNRHLKAQLPYKNESS